MAIKTPVLDSRTSEDIYRQALKLARSYCPELDIPDGADYFDPDDPGLVILKLFSKRMEFLINQFNKIPENHSLAFLDFAGMDPLPARPSRVPLTFYLTEGSRGAYIPARTRIASSEDPDVIFETVQSLSVVAAMPRAVLSLNPWKDAYTDHSAVVSGNDDNEDGFTVFGGDVDERAFDHVLCIGDNAMLDLHRPPSELTIHIEGSDITPGYFSRWCDSMDNRVNHPDFKDPSPDGGLAITIPIKGMKQSLIGGEENFWLLVRPQDGMIVKGAKLPVISRISVDVTVENILPEAAFFNNVPAEVKKGFYPFGNEPRRNDAFYLGSDEVFSKKGSEITLDIELETEIKDTVVTLRWEYWNGRGWGALKVTDGTGSFTKSDRVVIGSCPHIPAMEINGVLNRWVRARIISDRTYGTAGKLETKKIDDIVKNLSGKLKKPEKKVRDAMDGVTFGLEYKPPAFRPPAIQSIKISYSYIDVEPETVKAINNFRCKDLLLTDPEEPYVLTSGEVPALYIGFEENVSNIPITLFFAVKETLYGENPVRIKDPDHHGDFKPEDEANGLTWAHYNGTFWEDFNVEDETDSFRTTGIVRFIVPPEIKKTSEFERDMYWIRVKLNDGTWVSCPRLKGIFPNTVQALNNVTIRGEVLGSGNGEPDHILAFSNKPLLEGQIIEVKELDIPSEDEMNAIESSGGEDALRIVEESGEVKEVWVRWDEVGNFFLSGPLSRHYILNRANGTITFGDGSRGMVPTKGMNNIVAQLYRSGGGTRGEMGVGVVTSLKKAIPNIDSVTNHIPSSGGMNQETLDNMLNRGPHTIKNRNRAVTMEDFEWLAEEASQYVARAKCMVANGMVTVIIVPVCEGDTPLPDASLLDLVEHYLKDRAFLTITDRIGVVGPDYTKVNVRVSVKPVSIGETNIVSKRIKERLTTFLHPLEGGQTGKGWDFGENIYISQLAAVIEGTYGVDYVKRIVLTKAVPDGARVKEATGATGAEVTGIEQLLIEDNALPYAGEISVEIEG